MTSEDFETLIERLENNNLNIRLRAVSKLSNIGTSDVIEIFRRILKNKNEDTDVKRYVIESFLKFEPSEVIADLLSISENKGEELVVRMAAVYVIGKLENLPCSGLPVIGSDRNISDDIIGSFKKIIEDILENYTLRVEVLKSLKNQRVIVYLSPIGRYFNEKKKTIDIITSLENLVYDENENKYVRKYASEALMSIIPRRGKNVISP